MPILNSTDLLDGDLLYEGALVTLESAVIRSNIGGQPAVNAGTVVLPFGRATCLGANPGDVVLPVDANSVLLGIAYYSDTFEKREGFSLDADGLMGYPVDYQVSYVVRGVVGVKFTTAATITDPIFWIHTPDAGERKGQFRINANTNKAVQVANARLLKGGAAGSVLPLAINLP